MATRWLHGRTWCVALALGVLLGACSAKERHPRIEVVTPSAVLNDEAVVLEIRGENFDAVVRTSPDGRDPELDDTFSVRIGELVLEAAQLSTRLLRVELPKGAPPGDYDVTVVTPGGATGTMPGALHVDEPVCRVAIQPAVSPGPVNVGRQLTVSADVTTAGCRNSTLLLDVQSQGDGALSLLTGPSALVVAQDISQRLQWEYDATSEGSVALTFLAVDQEENLLGSGVVGPIQIDVPAGLSVTSEFTPRSVLIGEAFFLEVIVENVGTATATDLHATVIPSVPGLVSEQEAPTALELPGGGQAILTWTFTATGAGQTVLEVNLNATDANDGILVLQAHQTSSITIMDESQTLLDEPFGVSQEYAQVFVHAGDVYLGPAPDGGSFARTPVGGAVGAPVSFTTFSLLRDVTGNTHQNSGPSPFTSFGREGCTLDTIDCGPDNEDGLTFFTPVGYLGEEWLIAGGTQTGGDLEYIYATRDSGAVLNFAYVDLRDVLGGKTHSVSAVSAFQDRLYVGFPDSGGNRPYMVAIEMQAIQASFATGLDAEDPTQVRSMDAHSMPEIGKSSGVSGIDGIIAFNGLVYAVNDGGCVRSTVAEPEPYDEENTHWVSCTPSAASYAGHPSYATSKVSGILPEDRAIVSLVAFGGRLYALRNTVDGPQLWVCVPASTGHPLGCDPDDWSLRATNSAGDTELTQFNNPRNTTASLLVATEQHLYVGLNNETDGLVIFRTERVTPSTRADFEGRYGCSAALHPNGCPGFGGNGVGRGASRIMDWAQGPDSSLFLAVGGDAPSVVVLTD